MAMAQAGAAAAAATGLLVFLLYSAIHRVEEGHLAVYYRYGAPGSPPGAGIHSWPRDCAVLRFSPVFPPWVGSPCCFSSFPPMLVSPRRPGPMQSPCVFGSLNPQLLFLPLLPPCPVHKLAFGA